MSKQDRFFQQLASAREQVQGLIQQPASSSAAASGTALKRNDSSATLPVYTAQSTGPPVHEQLAMGRAGFKTVHTYPSPNGRVVLEIFTPPQKSPTFMGGSAERGRGALAGKVTLRSFDNDKVGAVRLKVKCVARVAVPPKDKAAASNPNNRPTMNHLSGRSPAHEGAQEREVLLLQLEQQLHTPGIDDGGRRGHLEPGTYEWPYRFNIPPQTNAGQELPPSYVLESGTRTKLNAVEEWASVKWYLKLTVEKPGLFKVNERVFAPFQYLPPPSARMVPILERRYRLSIQAHAIPRLRLENLIEPRTSWKSIKVDLNAKGGGGGGGSGGGSILALLGGKSKDGKSKEKWIMSLPAAPPIYPLRAAIPFALSQLGTGKGSQPPIVTLIQRTVLTGKANRVGQDKIICLGRLEALANNEWRGLLELTPQCGPCFECPILRQEYFIAVQRQQGAPPSHLEPIVVACPPPKAAPIPATPRVRSRPASPSRSSSRISPSRPPSQLPVKGGSPLPPSKYSRNGSVGVVRPISPQSQSHPARASRASDYGSPPSTAHEENRRRRRRGSPTPSAQSTISAASGASGGPSANNSNNRQTPTALSSVSRPGSVSGSGSGSGSGPGAGQGQGHAIVAQTAVSGAGSGSGSGSGKRVPPPNAPAPNGASVFAAPSLRKPSQPWETTSRMSAEHRSDRPVSWSGPDPPPPPHLHPHPPPPAHPSSSSSARPDSSSSSSSSRRRTSQGQGAPAPLTAMTMTPTPVASAATNASPPPPPPPIAQVAEPAPARGAADRTERWSFDDLEQEGMELPPSYYEAVGLHDTE